MREGGKATGRGMAHARVRYELFFKDVAQLKTSLQSLRARGRAVTRVNLPNKDKGDDIISWVDAVRECGETIDCVPHFSMKNNYERDSTRAAERLKRFASALRERKIDRCLLVSGSGSRVNDSVEMLRRLGMDRAWKREHSSFRFDVAFNPYFPETKDLEHEYDRLDRKVRTGLVRGVWFQIGTDLDALESGLTRVRKMVGPDVDIFCSVWLPSKQLLARMKFRPWAGVFLSEEYLGSVKRAEDITVSQLEIFARHGATALIESPVTKDADWAQCERLLARASSTSKKRDRDASDPPECVA